MQTVKLDVQGMSCDACVGHVTKALLALPGVESAEVSLADNTAIVSYIPALTQVSQMLEAIADEGYDAVRQV